MKIPNIRKDNKGVSPVIAIILMVAITVVLASVLYVWVMQIADTDPTPDKFPTIEAQLIRTINGDNQIVFEHKRGELVKWSEYQIIIENKSDLRDKIFLKELTGEIKFGETTMFTTNSSDHDAIYIADLSNIKLKVGQSYDLEIYKTEGQSQVLEREVICKSG
jgi:flagellin-like protein